MTDGSLSVVDEGDGSPILVALCANDRYAMSLAVTMFSVITNLPASALVKFFVVGSDFSKVTQEKILTVAAHAGGNVEVEFISPALDLISTLPVSGYFTSEMYLRILLPELLGPDIRKVLYLDSDILVCTNVMPLWRESVDGWALLAARDMGIPTVSDRLVNYRELGLSPNQPIFNSGVLLMNIDYWRDHDIAKQVLAYIVSHSEIIDGDQDALNAVLHDQWGRLDIKWNDMPKLREKLPSWPDSSLKEEVIAANFALTHQPSIMHFVGSLKPWHTEGHYPGKITWIKYFYKSQWLSGVERLAWLANWTVFSALGPFIRRIKRKSGIST